MSFKAVELQHALPKVQDIGIIQQQLNQKAILHQSQVVAQTKKIEEVKKKTTQKTKKSTLSEQNTLKTPKGNYDPRKGRFVDIEL